MKRAHVTQRTYVVNLPTDLATEIMGIARKHGTTELDVIRRFVRLGLLATNTPLFIKREEEYSEVEMFPQPIATVQ